MAQIAIEGSLPVQVEMGSALSLNDEQLFDLCRRNPELRIERSAQGDLIVMTPAGWRSGHRNARVVSALVAWADGDGRGIVSDSSAGFLLPDGAMRAPDAAWVSRARLADLPEGVKERFLPICPDFVVELRSPTDSVAGLRAKMEEYRENGTLLGWLLDPEERRAYVYRPGRQVEVLEDPESVLGDPELPGFTLDLRPIWKAP